MNIENERKWGNIALRSRALRLLEDVNSRGDAADLNKIIDKYNFTYHEFNPDTVKDSNRNLLGAVDYKMKRIFVNSQMPRDERHFTLAHEIAHMVLHPNKNQWDFRQANQTKNNAESEANVFAYELLMPLSKFRRAYIETNRDVYALSNRFFVPEDKINKRIKFLKKQIQDKKIDNFME